MVNQKSIKGEYRSVAVGASSGGMAAIGKLISPLPGTFPLTIIAVQHLHSSNRGYLCEYLRKCCALPVEEAADKAPVLCGHVVVRIG